MPKPIDESMLRVEPEIPGVTVNILGDTITIRGRHRRPHHLPGHGQWRRSRTSLARRWAGTSTLTFQVGPAEPFLIGPDSTFVTLDPASSKPVLSLYVMNYNRLDVQVYAVEPSDWPAFKRYLQEYQRTDLPPDPPGRLVRDEVCASKPPPTS